MVAPRQSLLQRLLAKEIRQERSTILQCLRFVVNNDFLQESGSKPLIFPDDDHATADAKAGESFAKPLLFSQILARSLLPDQ